MRRTRAAVMRWVSAATLTAPMAWPMLSQKCAPTAVTPRLTRFCITATPARAVSSQARRSPASVMLAKGRQGGRHALDDGLALLGRNGGQHGQPPGAHAQRAPAADLQHQRAYGEVAFEPVQAHGLESAAHHQVGRVLGFT